jgi:general secretion pathway protein M
MLKPLDARERRLAAVLVLALLIGAAWWLLVQSWFLGPLGELETRRDALQEQQQHYAALLQAREPLQRQLDTLLRDPASQGSLLPGDDPSAVAADLMQHSIDQVQAHAEEGPGCEVSQRMPIVPDQDTQQPYRMVKVSLTLDCAMQPLAGLLHDLEYGKPYVFVDSLSIRRAPSAPATGGAGRLQVHLLLRGYLQPAPPVEVSP